MSKFSEMETDTDSKFLKINPGESVQFHIISQEPKKSISHWINGKKFECEGDPCEYCSSGNKPRKGWKMRVFDRNSKTVKVYEFGPQVAAQIKNIDEILTENQQSVHDVDLRIKREGSGALDTEYFVNQVPMKEPVPAGLIEDDSIPF